MYPIKYTLYDVPYKMYPILSGTTRRCVIVGLGAYVTITPIQHHTQVNELAIELSWQWEHWSQLNCHTPRPTHACDLLIHEKRTLAGISSRPTNEFARAVYMVYAFTITHRRVLGPERIRCTL